MYLLTPIIVLGFLGILFGVGLYIASRVFYVPVDPRVEKIEHMLPGVNCGTCGLSGCSALAKAIVHGSADPSLCAPGGAKTASEIAKMMGIVVSVKGKKIAAVKCQRKDAKIKYEYDGEKTCISANMHQGGQYECSYACLGFGDCAKVCPFGAIKMIDGLPVIDMNICTACSKCIHTCPKNLITLQPIDKNVHVACSSGDIGKIAIKACKSACIACKKCEKVCEFDAIHVVDQLAVIDLMKCTSCGKCVEACPTHAIVKSA